VPRRIEEDDTVNGWLETYRGIVYRWEVDHNDHLTVAFYFAHLGDATLCLLDALGLGPAYTRRRRNVCVTADCYVRYVRELRVGDILHVVSGVIAVERDALVLGHKVFNSETGEVCTTVEHRLCHVDTQRRAARPFAAAQRRAAEQRRVEWDVPARERRARPSGLEGFHESSRDTVKPDEVDVLGQVALTHYVHRFSAANSHATAVFGVTPGYMRAERRGFSTFEFQLEFAGVLRPGDPVRIRSALVHVGNSSMRLFHVMTNERTGERVATLEQLGVHLDMDARRPTPLPDAIRDRAKAILVS
jgi:acyl-CoA thioester hydrolase